MIMNYSENNSSEVQNNQSNQLMDHRDSEAFEAFIKDSGLDPDQLSDGFWPETDVFIEDFHDFTNL